MEPGWLYLVLSMEKVKKINGTFLSFFYIFVTILTLLKCHYKGKGSCKYNVSTIGGRGSVKWGHLLTGGGGVIADWGVYKCTCAP